MVESRTAVVGDVDRTCVSFALTDVDGRFRAETVRRFHADRYATISSALMAFNKEIGLSVLPRRCAIAVAGAPRGDPISVTNSRWFVSRSGLAAILQRPPIVINNFAANVWAVSATDPAHIQSAGADAVPGSGPGTFLVLGGGNGLGAAAFIRDDNGQVTVLPTEAGHSELIDHSPEIAPLIDILRRRHSHLSAETLLGSEGMAALCNAIAGQQGGFASFTSAREVVHAASLGDECARQATILFGKALWRFAGNLTLIFSAWDGVFLAGDVINALQTTMALPEVRQGFIVPGPFANFLRHVPAGFLLLEDSELRGAAEALRQLQ